MGLIIQLVLARIQVAFANFLVCVYAIDAVDRYYRFGNFANHATLLLVTKINSIEY